MNFEYTIGDIKTTTPWSRPNKDLLYNWYKEFKKIPGIDNYEFWAGSALFNVEDTWDVDIVILGEVQDYNELKNILDTSIDLGFKNKQLIDIFHSNGLWYFDDVYKPVTKIRNWKYWTKYVNGNLIKYKTINNSEELIPGLFKKTYNTPPNSYLYGKDKFEKGEYDLNYRLLEDIFI